MPEIPPTSLEIWKWTLTKEAIAPCFVRDVHAMRESVDKDSDFFWLGYTPCRSVLLVGMVVAIQNYDKRAIYTIDDGTSVIDCVLRHPTPPKSKVPPTTSPNKKFQRSPQKKARFDKDGKTLDPVLSEPPPPITQPGYPIRVVGKIVKHYESRQIHADMLEPCKSSLDELDHLKRVVDLHKTKYSLAVPFVIPPPSDPATNSATDSSTLLPGSSTSQVDAGLFSSDVSRQDASTFDVTNSTCAINYKLPAPRVPLGNRPMPIPMHNSSASHGVGHIPSSPTSSSIASSTPSSPCKTSSPVKDSRFTEPKPKLRHPSRLHTRDLSASTFRLYVKHYMDNAPPPFPWSFNDEHGASEAVRTPTKRPRNVEGEDDDDRTPRPSFPRKTTQSTGHCEPPSLGFTLSHLRRVPELALLASRVVRTETRRREKAEREKAKKDGGHDGGRSVSQAKPHSSSTAFSRNGSSKPPLSVSASSTSSSDPPRKKMKRLFSWAVVKLYEEGSIILWDGDVCPLPIPPPPPGDNVGDTSGMWKSTVGNDTFGSSTCASTYHPTGCPSASMSLSRSSATSFLYSTSASASLYSHYHSPRRPSASDKSRTRAQVQDDGNADVDADADPANLSDPLMDEEAYVPLTARFLAPHVGQALTALREGRGRATVTATATAKGGNGSVVARTEPTVEDVVACLRRMDGRWARVGVWAVEEALEVLREG